MKPVSLFVTTILAFGTIAPVASVTFQAISPVVVDWAYKAVEAFKTQIAPGTASAIPTKNVTDPGNLIYFREGNSLAIQGSTAIARNKPLFMCNLRDDKLHSSGKLAESGYSQIEILVSSPNVSAPQNGGPLLRPA